MCMRQIGERGREWIYNVEPRCVKKKKKWNKQQRSALQFSCGEEGACNLAPADIGMEGRLESTCVLLSTLRTGNNVYNVCVYGVE